MIGISHVLFVVLSLSASSAGQADEFAPLDISSNLREQTRAAAETGDLEMARRTNAAALALQPGHPGLLNNQVILAGLAGDPDAQLAALEAIARAGLDYDLSALETAAALRERFPVRFEAAAARLAANGEPAGRAELLARVDLPDALIESLEIDIETERVFLGGIAERAIWVLEHGSETPRRFAGPEDGLYSVFALAVDSRNRLLYAATGTVAQTPLAEGERAGTALLAFDLMSGELMVRHEIEGAGRISGVTVRDGIVHASDAAAGRVYRLTGPLAELEVFSADPRFVSLQGLAVTAGSVWVADYALGLWRIDPQTGAAQLARTPASGESLIGLDALAVGPDGAIHAVRNGAEPMGVLRITLDDEGRLDDARPALTRHRAFGAHGEPTSLQIADQRAFLLANAQWVLFPEDGAAPDGEREPVRILTWPVD